MIIILGTPGAGKTTQAQLLADYLDCKWFSMGDLIRQKATGQDRKDMLAGKYISDEVTLNIINQTLSTIDTINNECVFEGNPRTIGQAKWWLQQAANGRFKITGLVHLVAEPSIAAKRLVNRGRLDDHDDNVVETRFKAYHDAINPTLDYLKSHGVEVHDVDANGTIEEEFKLIRQTLGI